LTRGQLAQHIADCEIINDDTKVELIGKYNKRYKTSS